MKSWRQIAAAVACLAVVCAATVFWSVHKKEVAERKLAEAAGLCRARAERGDAQAQFELGTMYRKGEGVRRDHTEALGWYRKAADQNYAKAQDALGSVYYYGHGAPQNYEEAVRWYRKAADQGYASAEYDLAYMYDLGKGVPQDSAEAIRWYRKSAEQGNVRAQDWLGYVYSQGKGVPQDSAMAVFWYSKAAKQGDEYAQRALSLREMRGSAGRFRRTLYLFLLIISVGGLWLSIDLLVRGRSARGLRQRAAGLLGASYAESWPRSMRSLRSFLSLIFAISSLICLEIAVRHSGAAAHRQYSVLSWRTLLVPALFSIMGVIFGAAWFTAWRRKSSTQGWGIAASLINLLLPLATSVYSWVPLWRHEIILLVIGVAGLVAFSWRDSTITAPGAPTRVDGTSGLIDKVSGLLFIVLNLAPFFWWYGWMRARNTLEHRSDLYEFALILLVALTITTLHELGHTATGLALGMKLRAFAAGPFEWFIREGKWNFQFRPSAILSAGGATGVVPLSPDFPRSRELLMVAAGPFVSLLTGMIALWIALTVKDNSPAQLGGLLALFGAWSLALAVGNLLPFTSGENYSDGAQIYQRLSNGPWADYHRAMTVVLSSLVTPLRPKDYDIKAILRAADTFTQGKRALLLRLFAYSHFLDCGKLPEAAEALKEAESIYRQSASDIPAELHTAFVFGNAYLRRDAVAAREWWTRMEAKKPTHRNVDYWRAYSALRWLEGDMKEANEAWERSNALAQQLPKAGTYEFDRYCCSILRTALDDASVRDVQSLSPQR